MPVKATSDTTMLSAPLQQIDSLWADSTIFPSNLFECDYFNDTKLFDIEGLEENTLLNTFTSENVDFSDILLSPQSPKHQIRNHDCMWSGTCVDENHPSKKSKLSFLQRIPSTSASISSSQQQSQQQINDNNSTMRATVESISTKYTATTKAIMTPNLMKTIAPSSSQALYINTRVNTNTALLRCNQQMKDCKTSIDSKDFESIISPSGLRPDTPLSLGDDVQDYKNNIDLTPCPSGNRMKFSESPEKIINMLRVHLEDSVNDTSSSSFVNSLLFNKNQKTAPSDLTDILTDITFLSDYEDNVADDSSNVDMDEEMTDEIMDMKNYNKLHQQPSTSSSLTINGIISDHSYTRPKGSKEYYSELGVCTPSDSDEDEIDVVNIVAKNLPTNPSASDRRALQTTVARIARSKQSSQRRRVSDDDSISSSTSTLSSKGSTPIKIGSQTPQRFLYSAGAASRKRKDNTISQKYRYQSSSKKQRLHSKHAVRQVIDPDEAETIEKRNLHNNMERQRRIGLKNLFEELKRQIPTLREKERAPKVNILREAAAYCTKLRRDDDLHNELTKKNQRLMTKLRNLKAQAAARRNY